MRKFLVNPLYDGLLIKRENWSNGETTYRNFKTIGDQKSREKNIVTKEKH